jgi:alkanesulfonate monooxygenase SsuD/methylene tetrahydromethanopterin reductase-like flavin-dependent oxidoreductase (luciferase family)
LVLCCGSDETEVERRAQHTGQGAARLRRSQLGGTPDELVARMQEYAGIGASRLYLQTLDLHDLDHLRLVAAEVMPRV